MGANRGKGGESRKHLLQKISKIILEGLGISFYFRSNKLKVILRNRMFLLLLGSPSRLDMNLKNSALVIYLHLNSSQTVGNPK